MEEQCLSPEELERLGKGDLVAEEGSCIERHLSECAPCREAAAAASDPELWGNGETRRKPRALPGSLRWVAWGGVAAALLFAFWTYNPLPVPTVTDAELVSVRRQGGVFFEISDVNTGLTLSQSIRAGQKIWVRSDARLEMIWKGRGKVQIGPGSRFRMEREEGGKERLRLDSGILHVDASGPDSFFPVATSAGIVRDIGTRFTVRAGETPAEPTFQSASVSSIPVSLVEVTEGKVVLSNVHGTTDLHAGQRGYLWEGQPPAGPVEIRPLSDEQIRQTVQRTVPWMLENPDADPVRGWTELLNLGPRAATLDSAWEFPEEKLEAADRIREWLFYIHRE